jgi:Ca2+-binding EF-hand superfamily protein
MKKTLTTLAALALFSTAALAQTASTDGAAKDPSAQMFATLDADKSGFLENKELDTVKAKMTILDMDKDGKVSAQEFNMGYMTGVITK